MIEKRPVSGKSVAEVLLLMYYIITGMAAMEHYSFCFLVFSVYMSLYILSYNI